MTTAAPSSPLDALGIVASPAIAVEVPARLHPPIDISRIKKENGVKELIKQLLDAHGWFHFAVAAGGYSAPGLHDRFAIKDGVFLSIEAKFYPNKVSTMQKAFGAQVIANDCFAFCVHQLNIDHLAWWLESFEIAKQCQMVSREVPPEHGSRLLNAISALTDPFADG